MSSSPSTPSDFDAEEYVEVQRLADRSLDHDFEKDVRQVIERGLASDPDRFRAVRNLLQMLSRYLGDWDTSFILLSLIGAQPGGVEEQEAFAAIGDPVKREHLRGVAARLGALYGEEVQVGLDLSARNPNDWKSIRVRTLFELEAGTWSIEVLMQQFDQQEITIAGDPLSILRLTNNLLGALRGVAPQTDDFPALMDPDEIVAFGELARELIEALESVDDEG